VEGPHIHRCWVYVARALVESRGQLTRGVAREGQGGDALGGLGATVVLMGMQMGDTPQERLRLPAPRPGAHEEGAAWVGVSCRVLIDIERYGGIRHVILLGDKDGGEREPTRASPSPVEWIGATPTGPS